jgi:hypothetical protein
MLSSFLVVPSSCEEAELAVYYFVLLEYTEMLFRTPTKKLGLHLDHPRSFPTGEDHGAVHQLSNLRFEHAKVLGFFVHTGDIQTSREEQTNHSVDEFSIFGRIELVDGGTGVRIRGTEGRCT